MDDGGDDRLAGGPANHGDAVGAELLGEEFGHKRDGWA